MIPFSDEGVGRKPVELVPPFTEGRVGEGEWPLGMEREDMALVDVMRDSSDIDNLQSKGIEAVYASANLFRCF